MRANKVTYCISMFVLFFLFLFKTHQFRSWASWRREIFIKSTWSKCERKGQKEQHAINRSVHEVASDCLSHVHWLGLLGLYEDI